MKGQRRVSSMLSGWAAEDRRAQGNAAIIPAWRCSTPTVFNSTAVRVYTIPLAGYSNNLALQKLFITIPLARQPSHFHSDIYLAAKAVCTHSDQPTRHANILLASSTMRAMCHLYLRHDGLAILT